MSSLSSAKTLGGVGAILMLVASFTIFAFFIGPIISIVGLVLVYLGVKNISEVVNNPKIKSDFVLCIVMLIIATVVLIAWPFIALGGFGFSFTALNPTDPFAAVGTGIAICIIVFLIAVIFYIMHAVYLKKSFDAISRHTNVGMFSTTGIVYLIGAILTIFIFGFIILLIANILMIVAFFSLPDQLQPMPQQGGYGYGQPPQQQYGAPPQQPYSPPPPQQQQYTPPPPPPQQQPPQQQSGRFCPGCGRPIPMDAQVCPYCGKDFRQK